MDVINILLILVGLAIVVVALYVAVLLLRAALEILWMWAPLVVGVASAIWLWKIEHDNFAVTAAIVGFVVQFFFWPAFKDKGGGGGGGYYDPLEGKTKLYDKDGNVTGAKDKE